MGDHASLVRVPLTNVDRAILDFERCWWMLPAPKSAGIREHLELSPTRYYRLLNALLDNPDALAYDPLVVHRLRRTRLQRRRARFVGRTGLGLGR